MNAQEIVNKGFTFVISYGVDILAALIIFIFGRWIAKAVSRFVERVSLKSHAEETLAKFLKNITYFLILAAVIIAAVGKLGVQTTSLVAVIGAAGLAVGLALQGSLANFASGVLLIIFKPFKAGDFVEAGGAMGSVQEVQIFNTILSSPDNRKIILPNAKITGDKITNFSSIEKRRIDLIFGISYKDDMKTAKDVLTKIVTSDTRIMKDPAPVIAVYELGDSSVNLVCRPWVKPSDYWNVYFDTVEKGKLELEKKGITIPFPQRDVHLFEEKST